MARILGGLTTSHIPAIGNAVPREDELLADDYGAPFFAGYGKAREWLHAEEPDVAIVVYNDHGLNFFLDKMQISKIMKTMIKMIQNIQLALLILKSD